MSKWHQQVVLAFIVLLVSGTTLCLFVKKHLRSKKTHIMVVSSRYGNLSLEITISYQSASLMMSYRDHGDGVTALTFHRNILIQFTKGRKLWFSSNA